MLSLLRRILAPWEDQIGESTFFGEPRKERLARLQTQDPVVARELLEEARRLNDSVQVTAEGVERRATTLQGVVSIAATVTVAGGALLLDPGKIHGLGWRAILAVLFGCLLYCLIATAYRATQSSTQIQAWTLEDPNDHLGRTSHSVQEVDTELTADMLYGYGRNMEVVRWKVSYLRAASEWFLRGLIFLGFIAATFTAYALFHSNDAAHETSLQPPIRINQKAEVDGAHHNRRDSQVTPPHQR